MSAKPTPTPFCGDHPLMIEGTTIYQLMHHGWRNGEEIFRNRIYFNVYVDSQSGLKENEVAAEIHRCVNAMPAMVEAAEKALHRLRRANVHIDCTDEISDLIGALALAKGE